MSNRDSQISQVGALLSRAWNDFSTLGALSEDLYPRDLDEAAAMQTAMARNIGESVVGWKVGGAPGPMVGRIFTSRCYTGSVKLPAAQRVHHPAVECEIAFRVEKPLPARTVSYSRADVIEAATLLFAIEMVGTRFTNGKHIPDTEYERLAIVADNSAGAGLIVGPSVTDWQDLDLLNIPIELSIDGNEPMPLNPIDGRFDPVATLEWLANDLSRRRIGLEVGQYVTTGSATLLQVLPFGSTAVAKFADYGEISVGWEDPGSN